MKKIVTILATPSIWVSIGVGIVSTFEHIGPTNIGGFFFHTW
jgi:hypothetical protein